MVHVQKSFVNEDIEKLLTIFRSIKDISLNDKLEMYISLYCN